MRKRRGEENAQVSIRLPKNVDNQPIGIRILCVQSIFFRGVILVCLSLPTLRHKQVHTRKPRFSVTRYLDFRDRVRVRVCVCARARRGNGRNKQKQTHGPIHSTGLQLHDWGERNGQRFERERVFLTERVWVCVW